MSTPDLLPYVDSSKVNPNVAKVHGSTINRPLPAYASAVADARDKHQAIRADQRLSPSGRTEALASVGATTLHKIFSQAQRGIEAMGSELDQAEKKAGATRAVNILEVGKRLGFADLCNAAICIQVDVANQLDNARKGIRGLSTDPLKARIAIEREVGAGNAFVLAAIESLYDSSSYLSDVGLELSSLRNLYWRNVAPEAFEVVEIHRAALQTYLYNVATARAQVAKALGQQSLSDIPEWAVVTGAAKRVNGAQ